MSRGGTKPIPVSIDRREVVIRAILTPYHVKKNKLQRGAFKAPSGSDEVSVSRRWYLPPWLSKAYAKRWVQRPLESQPKIYEGLAFVSVEAVRSSKSDVVDSRLEYLGHADIKHGIIQERGMALAPDIRKELDDRLEKLAQAAKYIKDPQPHRIRWGHDT